MKQSLSPREHAMALIAAYDRPEADDQEQELVRIAKIWQSVMNTPEPVQSMIDELVADLDRYDDGSCGWRDLKTSFLSWAKREDWI